MRWVLLAAALLAAPLVTAAEAEPKASDVLKPIEAREVASPINDHFALRGSYSSTALGTHMRLDDANIRLGTELSAENDFGMRSKLDQGRMELTLRLRDRNRIRFDYLKLTRKGNAVLDRTIDFGDETFLATDRVLSLLDWRMLNFTYLYSVFHNPRFELGAGLGLHILDGEAHARVPARLINEEKSGVTIFPTLALDATVGKEWWVGDSWGLGFAGDFTYLSAPDKDLYGSSDNWGVTGFGIRFSATFN